MGYQGTNENLRLALFRVAGIFHFGSTGIGKRSSAPQHIGAWTSSPARIAEKSLRFALPELPGRV
ncbi:MAG: hypothetical protein NVSMB1_09180 [Polyangiales bacterium]